MSTDPFLKFIKTLDDQAARVEDRDGFWAALSCALRIWTSGGTPAPAWDPCVNHDFQPLFKALKRFGFDRLSVAVDARAFGI